jgi:TPR repeat protein
MELRVRIAVNHFAVAGYFKLAADQDHAEGQYVHANCLMNGSGVSVIRAQAAGSFKWAADPGSRDTQ